MPYVLRNMIFIGVFWLLLLIGGIYYVKSTMAGKVRELHMQNAEKEKRIEELLSLQDDQTVLTEHLERLRSISMGEIGALVSQEKPGELFQYILDEIQMTKGDMSVNLVHESNMVKPGFSSREYSINGKSKFQDIYNLIYNLENGPIFFNVKNLTMRKPEEMDETQAEMDLIEYSLTVESYNRESGPDIKEIDIESFNSQQVNTLFNNPTSKLVTREKEKEGKQDSGPSGSADSRPRQQENGDPRETSSPTKPSKTIRIQDYKILGMTHRSIILQSPSGATEKLRINEELKGAELVDIDILNGKAIFQVNQNGVNRQIVLLK